MRSKWGVSIFASVFMILNSNVHSEPGVTVDLKMSPMGSFQATTKDIKGKIKLKNNELMAENLSVSLKNLTSKLEFRDKHMREKYLEVDKFPEATLLLGKGKDGKGDGKIKIKGIEQPIKGTYKLVNDSEVEATFEIKLSDFKITGIKHAGVGVKDQAVVTVVVPVEKEIKPVADVKKK